jgi:hypothetical protein
MKTIVKNSSKFNIITINNRRLVPKTCDINFNLSAHVNNKSNLIRLGEELSANIIHLLADKLFVFEDDPLLPTFVELEKAEILGIILIPKDSSLGRVIIKFVEDFIRVEIEDEIDSKEYIVDPQNTGVGVYIS